MRTNARPACGIGQGIVPWTRYRRVTVYLAPDTFELLREHAVERGVGNGVVAREWLEDRIAEETKCESLTKSSATARLLAAVGRRL